MFKLNKIIWPVNYDAAHRHQYFKIPRIFSFIYLCTTHHQCNAINALEFFFFLPSFFYAFLATKIRLMYAYCFSKRKAEASIYTYEKWERTTHA